MFQYFLRIACFNLNLHWPITLVIENLSATFICIHFYQFPFPAEETKKMKNYKNGSTKTQYFPKAFRYFWVKIIEKVGSRTQKRIASKLQLNGRIENSSEKHSHANRVWNSYKITNHKQNLLMGWFNSLQRNSMGIDCKL